MINGQLSFSHAEIVTTSASKSSSGAPWPHKFQNDPCVSNTKNGRTPWSEEEALGLVSTVSKFYKMLPGRIFRLCTDYKPTFAIFREKNPLPVTMQTYYVDG